ncbi:sensor domain-containing diguanylate cyclase [Paenibacillus harenae]|uniref:Diguanylate cyclase (GGDEF)-like protein n=1 Tax=Paenibacillus harenae TaxID=306543 RepID=A0ABT9U881_PAEHA|nr:sensor domain-containing diguanylate cyclase [Paenibacillus harenae]MDQ0115452.1 diguanylate cyclase (GGDEF)-like protein [Paenibacillus harenae]
MSSHDRSLEDAAEHIIDTLKHFLQVNMILIATSDTTSNRILRAFNRGDDNHTDMLTHSLLSPLCKLVVDHGFSHLAIPDLSDDSRTSQLPDIDQLPQSCSLVGVPVKTSSNEAVGAICLLGKGPIGLNEQQLSIVKSMAAILGYVIELENASVTDSLTGLYNRRYLSHVYQSGADKQFSVMFIDIDDFKDVNDTYGHDFGDLLLLEISGRLKQNVRKSDILVRYGGDEFLICFQHLVDNQDIEFVASKIRDSIKEPFEIRDQTIRISASIGISANYGLGSSLKELISDADQAMYGVKQNEKSL